MEELKKRVEMSGFKITYNPRGDGNCFFNTAAHQLDLDVESLKGLTFNYLENHQFDVSMHLILLN